MGSVRARASQYRLTWDEANPGSCGLQDGQHRHTPPEGEERASVGGNMLVMAGARGEEVAQFIVRPAEPSGRSGAFEPPHGAVAAFAKVMCAHRAQRQNSPAAKRTINGGILLANSLRGRRRL